MAASASTITLDEPHRRSGCGCFAGLFARRSNFDVRERLRHSVKYEVQSRQTYPSQAGALSLPLLLLSANTGTLKSAYKVDMKLGSGGFGSVYRVVHKETGAERAAKIIDKSIKPDNPGYVDMIVNELDMMLRLEHPNVARCYDYFDEGTKIWLVSELCTEGDYYDLNCTIRDPQEVKKLWKDMALAINYCHGLGVVHRDLKFDNCLIAMGRGGRVGKVIDFGLSVLKKANDKDGRWLSGRAGTSFFLAPEVVSGNNYGVKCDCWSLGVMLYISFTDEHPIAEDLQKLPRKKLLQAITNKRRPIRQKPLEDPRVRPNLKDLVLRLLDRSPETRLSAKEALQHAWFALERSDTSDLLPMTPIVQRLKCFGHYSRFEKAVLALVAFQTDSSEAELLREQFSRLDTDQGGTLTRDELKQALALEGQSFSDDEFEVIWQALDMDATGKVNYMEWLTATMKPDNLKSKQQVDRLFNFFDQDGTGKVSRDNLRQFFGSADANSILKAASEATGHQGDELSYDEFHALILNIAKSMCPNECPRKRSPSTSKPDPGAPKAAPGAPTPAPAASKPAPGAAKPAPGASKLAPGAAKPAPGAAKPRSS